LADLTTRLSKDPALPVAQKTTHLRQIDIHRRKSLGELEELIRELNTATGDQTQWWLRLAAQTSNDIFAEVWTAILVGTASIVGGRATTVVPWGIRSWPPEPHLSTFAQSLFGLVAIQMADVVCTDVDHVLIDPEPVERAISLKHKGILEPIGGSSRTLVEFDPQQPVALALQDSRRIHDGITAQRIVRRRLFQQLIIQFRSDLEVGNLKRQVSTSDAGAVGKLASFLREVHENAYEHGRIISGDGRPPRSIRFLRLRKYLANNPQEMHARAGSFTSLRRYMEQSAIGAGTQAFVAAAVSDFGLGIVDHFLQSARGKFYRDISRRELLTKLLSEKLSSKSSDEDAGRGILDALEAARDMSGFVSLRTGEFWLSRSFAQPGVPLQLEDVEETAIPHVAGTHWQFVWPQPL
jgi:hypothetical protein